MTQFDTMTDEKSRYIEEQVNKLFDFFMESRQQLSGEAHTTLNWLFVVMIGSCGYLPTLLDFKSPFQWWLIAPLAIGAALCACEAARLFYHGMQPMAVLPAGNDPKNLLKDEFLEYDIAWMRAAETAQMQERLDVARQHNIAVADSITHARWFLVILPFIEVAIGTITRLAIGA